MSRPGRRQHNRGWFRKGHDPRLRKAVRVSADYLLCLSDDMESEFETAGAS